MLPKLTVLQPLWEKLEGKKAATGILFDRKSLSIAQHQHGLHHTGSVTHRLFAVSPRAIVSQADAMGSTRALLEPLGRPVSESIARPAVHLSERKPGFHVESTDAGQSYSAFYSADPGLQHEVGAAQFSAIFSLRTAEKWLVSSPPSARSGMMHCIRLQVMAALQDVTP